MEQRKRKKNEKCRGRKSCRFETLSLEEVFVRINETNAFNVEIVRELEFRPWIYFSSPLIPCSIPVFRAISDRRSKESAQTFSRVSYFQFARYRPLLSACSVVDDRSGTAGREDTEE